MFLAPPLYRQCEVFTSLLNGLQRLGALEIDDAFPFMIKRSVIFISVTLLVTAILTSDWKNGSPITPIVSTATPIRNFRLYGPFSNAELAFEANALLTPENQDVYLARPIAFSNSAEVITSQGLFDIKAAIGGDRTDKPTRLSYFTTASLFNGKADITAYLCVGGDDLVRVWWNNTLVYTSSRPNKFFGSHALVQVTAVAGLNALVIQSKSVNEGAQRFRAVIGTDYTSAAETYIADGGPLFKDFITPNGTLVLPWLPRKSPPIEKLIVSHNGQNVPGNVMDGTWNPSSNPPDDILNVTIDFGTGLHTEVIYSGDAVAKALAIVRALKETPDGSKKDAIALVRRLEVLLKPDNRLLTDTEWQKKLVWTIREADRLIATPQKASNIPPPDGIHLHAFQSKIDGQYFFYRIFIPPGVDSTVPLAMAILVPTSTSANRAFIDSVFIARHIEAERWSALAAKHNIAVLWMGYRAQPYGNESDFTYMQEVLDDVTSRYSIDPRRLSLMATCRAGMTALMYAERWPDRFSALGLVDPIVERTSNHPQYDGTYDRFPAYLQWLASREPYSNLSHFSHGALYVIHDGTEPGHGSLSEAEELVANARRAGAEATLFHVEPSVLHLSSWDRVMGLLAKKVKLSNDSKPFVRPEVVNSTITAAVNEPFVMVTPTRLTSAEKIAADRLVKQCTELWERSNYTACRVLSDTEITEDIEKRYNLVLIGNAATNSIWGNYRAKLRAEMNGNTVSISGKVVERNACGFVAAEPNPKYPERLLVFVGGGPLRETAIGEFDWDSDGWFQFAAWGRHTPQSEPELSVAGRFADLNVP